MFQFFVSSPPAATPAAPTNPSATALSSTVIEIGWTNNATNQTGFPIEMSTDDATWNVIATAGQSATSYNVGGLLPYTLYYFRVAASNGAGTSSYTSSVNATTLTAANNLILLGVG
jgi:hypothetical protein